MLVSVKLAILHCQHSNCYVVKGTQQFLPYKHLFWRPTSQKRIYGFRPKRHYWHVLKTILENDSKSYKKENYVGILISKAKLVSVLHFKIFHINQFKS